MDYLDRRKELEQRVLLFAGYILVGIALVLITLLLWRLASGYGIDKHGQVIQRGLTFFSSHPSSADIYVDGKLQATQTDTRLSLPGGIYNIRLTRDGYYDWQRKIEIAGGKVTHYDYPFLFPESLTTTKIKGYTSAPGFITQSPDRRWLLVQTPASLESFDLYDLKNPNKAPATLALPANLLSQSNAAQAWQLVEWAADSRHVLLRHVYGSKSEFIVVDRASIGLSLNLNTTLSLSPDKLSLGNHRYDRYYLYDNSRRTLSTATLDRLAPALLLQRVLAYKTYAADTVLYVTDAGAPKGKVFLNMAIADKVYKIRELPAQTAYVLDLAKYSDTLYIAAGAASLNRVYIYKDPAGQIEAQPGRLPAISQVLRVEKVNYLSFSTSAQFIVAEKGRRFGVYDIENAAGYNYTAPAAIDKPQTHAEWMDGNRLSYVSHGKLLVFDYDNINRHSLMPASSRYLPAFAPDYKFVYSLVVKSKAQTSLTQTSLLAPSDR
jgi:hypothetical protein